MPSMEIPSVSPALEKESAALNDPSNNGFVQQVGSVDSRGRPRAPDELRNMFLLGFIFMIYFGFRAGCLVVVPLCSKELLKKHLQGENFSPLYNLPLGLWFFMDVLLATPNAYLMRKYGRRCGFVLGGIASFVGSMMAFFFLWFGEDPVTTFVLLNLAVVVMSQAGMCEFVRYAAGEACMDPQRRGKVVSRVIAFGACLSMVGPASATLSQDFAAWNDETVVRGYAYYFLCCAALSLVLTGAAALLRLPAMAEENAVPAAPLCTVLSRPKVWTAIVAQVSVQFAMIGPMSGLSLAMMDSNPDLRQEDFKISGCVIVHVLGMFLPGLVTGSIIHRVGELPVMAAGLIWQAAALIVCLTGKHYAQFYTGLILLGIGWNLSFLAGTLMLTKSHLNSEKAKVTSANETLRFLANGISVILASTLDWYRLCTFSLVMLPFAAAVIVQRMKASE